jgi:MFS transporter, MHS family, alpha-ketoglutarate permease
MIAIPRLRASPFARNDSQPAHVRALGVAVAHSVAVALFGGSAEYVALWFKRAGHEPYFYWYVAIVCGISFMTALLMREPRRVTMQD